MQEVLKFSLGILVLAVGFFIGNYLAKITKEELADGKNWFKLIIFLSVIGCIVSLIFRSDVYLFSFLFIIAVTSRSLIR